MDTTPEELSTFPTANGRTVRLIADYYAYRLIADNHTEEPAANTEEYAVFDGNRDKVKWSEFNEQVFDAETGESIGDIVPTNMLDSRGQLTIDEGLANYVVRRILSHRSRRQSADLARIRAAAEIQEATDAAMNDLLATPKMIELQAIVTSAERMAEQADKNEAFYLTRYSGALSDYARMNLKGKVRTLVTPYGDISLTTVRAKYDVADSAVFIDASKRLGWDAVKESPLKGSIPSDIRSHIAGLPEADAREFAASLGIAYEPQGQQLTVKTQESA